MLAPDIFRAVRNLLHHCAAMEPGQSLLIVGEEPALGVYAADITQALAAAARDLDVMVDVVFAPFTEVAADVPEDLRALMDAHDRTVFLSRLGDQLRFSPAMAHQRPIVCYALDAGMLASGFGQADHRGLTELKDVINAALSRTEQIRITCPLGTDLTGPGAAFPEDGDTTVVRFPLSVFSPVPAAGFKGRIAQTGFLVGTGSRYYAPYGIGLEDTVFVVMDGARITGFEGGVRDVAAARAHYLYVGAKFGIDPWSIHSWHAGIHPGCDYVQPAGENLERWAEGAFGNPRLLHFHTCGDQPPGEISLNVVDPTIRLDGVPVWEAGRLHPERMTGGAELLGRYACLKALFAAPARALGLGPGERLSLAAPVAQVAAPETR